MKTKTVLMIASACALFLAGCSLLNPKPPAQVIGPEIHDVPLQARSGDLSPRKRIMVLPFIDAGAHSEKAANAARDTFIRGLKRSDEFVIVASSDFPKDVASFIKNGAYDLEAMAKIGAGMGLAAILEGRILDLKAKRLGDDIGLVRDIHARLDATVQVRLVNTKNSSIALDETRAANVEDTTTRVGQRSSSDKFLEEDPKLVEGVVTRAFQGLIPHVVQNIQKLSWEGRVALVKNDRVYLNAGRLTGLQVGDILKVSEEGEDVYDPESGTLIGKVPGRLKGTIELISYFGKDGAIGIVHSGSGFRENDRVELY